MEFLQPPDWPKPKGFSNGIAATGRNVYIAGHVGWNAREERFETDDFVAQSAQALRNVLTVLAEAGGRPEHITRLTWYILDRADYSNNLKALGEAYRAVMGRHFPVMAMVQVVALMVDRAKVEIEATAVIP